MTNRHGVHILVVDDDPKIRLLLRRLFEGEGFRVSEAGSGSDAENVAGSEQLDLITLDLGLPDADGFRSRAPFAAVPGCRSSW